MSKNIEDSEINDSEMENSDDEQINENPNKWKIFYAENKKLIWGSIVAVVIVFIVIIISSMKSTNSTTTNPNPTTPITPTVPKKKTGELCSVDRDCTIDNICAGGVCLPDLGVINLNNVRYNLKFKNLDTGKYLCLKPGVTQDLAYASDRSNPNECVWRTKINGDGKLQIIRNLNNNSIGPKLQAYIGYSSDNKSLDTKWNYIDDSKVLKNNYYSIDYPAGVQSNIDAYTGGCLSNINADAIKAGTAMCSANNNKWIPEYVSSSNCLADSECPSGKCTNNMCLSKDGEWCNVPESCASGICTDLKCASPAPITATSTLKHGSYIKFRSQLYDIFLNYCDNLENDSCKGFLARVSPMDHNSGYWFIERSGARDREEIYYGDDIILYQVVNGIKYYLSTCGSTTNPITGYFVVCSPRIDLSMGWRIRSSSGVTGAIKTNSNIFMENSYNWNTRLGMFSGGPKVSGCDGWMALTSLNFNDRDETKWTVFLVK